MIADAPALALRLAIGRPPLETGGLPALVRRTENLLKEGASPCG
jgi:hypothetical protein